MNIENIKFRASSMGNIMSGTGKNWSVEDSLTCKRELVKIYRQLKWHRRENKSNKYTEKGTTVENDAITIYCRVKKQMFKKNDIRLSNDYFTGELDLYEGESITKADLVIDIKSSWDWTTFPSLCDKLDADYEYQGLTYMDLTASKKHIIAYCLCNTPENLIMDEKRRLAWKMGVIDNETDEYIQSCIEIEKNCIYDMELFKKENPFFQFHCTDWNYDIPINERVYEIEVPRNDIKIESMKKRVIECRNWMSKNFY